MFGWITFWKSEMNQNQTVLFSSCDVLEYGGTKTTPHNSTHPAFDFTASGAWL